MISPDQGIESAQDGWLKEWMNETMMSERTNERRRASEHLLLAWLWTRLEIEYEERGVEADSFCDVDEGA